jgi:peptidoglycan/xylan/chitin deacetylase (PgdA/CDA1 family)
MNRRQMVGGLGAGGIAAWGTSSLALDRTPTPSLAVTLDDFEIVDAPRLTGAQRHAAILAALDEHRIKAAGFPAGKFIDNEAASIYLSAWARHGHVIGNHSYSHPFYGGASPEKMMSDILRAEPLLAAYPTFRKLFRFPYLAEGKTAEGRDRLRVLLKQNGYRDAYVTIDTSDWYVSGRLVTRLSEDPSADLRPYRDYYLDHLWSRATFYDSLAQRLLGRSAHHTILLHHNLASGLFLSDSLAMFKRRGWHLRNASDTYADPLYEREPDIVPAGQSLLWALAKERGGFDSELRYPGEDDTYEKPAMDRLNL